MVQIQFILCIFSSYLDQRNALFTKYMQIWEAAIVKCQKIFILVFAALIDLKTLQKSAFISV